MQKILAGYEKTKVAEARLKDQLTLLKDSLTKMQADIVKIKEVYDEAKREAQNLALTPEARAKASDKQIELDRILNLRQTELKEYAQSGQKQISANYEETRSEMVAEISKVVRNKATLEGYSLVLDKSGMTLNQLSIVIYSDSSLDITESIITELNRIYRDTLKTPKAPKDAAPEKAETEKAEK